MSGGFVQVAQAIDEAYLEGKISINLYPFARSLKNVQRNEADFHIPLIKHSNLAIESLPFIYASETITQVTFVLYSHAKQPPLNLDNLNQYTLGTQRGHKQFFPFGIQEINNLEMGGAIR